PDKFYDFVENKLTLVGSSTKFTIGDEVKIKVANVNVEDRKIDFNFVSAKNCKKTCVGEQK
ncbi:MAG: hypothetical protein ACI4TI_01300, partial [Christensenellales bacterium]